MRTYKFNTKISEDGIIQIPYNPALYDKEVVITIRPKYESNEKSHKATDFVAKYAGFLKNEHIEENKYDYLTNKYK